MGRPAKYWVIVESLQEQIAQMGPNTLLATEQQLAHRFQVSRITVRRALSFLQRKGVLSRERGRGTIVNPPKITRHLVPASPIEQDLESQGLNLETRIVAWRPKVSPPDPVRKLLELDRRAPAAFLAMVRLVDGRVICHDERYFPLPPGKDFEPAATRTRAFSQVLEELWGRKMASDTWETEIAPATPCFADGRPAETGVMTYRIDRVKFRFSTADLATPRRAAPGRRTAASPGRAGRRAGGALRVREPK